MAEKAPPEGRLSAQECGDGGVAPKSPVVEEQPDVVRDVVAGQPESLVVDPLPGLRLGEDRKHPFEAMHPRCAEGTISVEDEKGRRRGHDPMLRGAFRPIHRAREASLQESCVARPIPAQSPRQRNNPQTWFPPCNDSSHKF